MNGFKPILIIKSWLKLGLVVCSIFALFILSIAILPKMVDASVITAPTISTTTVAPGTVVGSTKMTLTPNQKGDTFKYKVGDAALTPLPVIGAALPNGTADYTAGSDITGVDATTNKYVDIYEIDASSKIVALKEFTLTGISIAAPALTVAPTVASGTVAGSVKLTLTSNQQGDTFMVQVLSKQTKLPGIGTKASGKVYISGNDLTGVDATKNKYIDVFEVDSKGLVVAFVELTLTSSAVTAPTISTTTVAPGTVVGSTKMTLTPNQKGDTFKYKVGDAALTPLPVIGAALPNGTADYTAGSDITGVDATTSKYVDIYEIDASSKIVALKEFTLTGISIAAPALTVAPTVASGTVAGSVKLTLTSNQQGDTFMVQVLSKQTKLPGIGTKASW